MTLILITVLGLAAGYVAAILVYLFFTLSLTAIAPHMVAVHGRFRTLYLLISYAVWLLCAVLGGYLSTWLTTTGTAAWLPWLPVGVLAIALTTVAWLHPIEAREQLVGLSRPLMALASLAGVVLGCYLRVHP